MAGGDVAALIPGPVGIDDLYLLTQPEDQPPTGSLPVPYSGFVIPDDVLNGTAKQHSQAGPDTIDFQALAAADSGVGVVSGCAVSPGGGLLLSVAAGSVVPVASSATVTVGANTVSVTPDLTLDRWTLICATATGIVLALPGMPAAPFSTTTAGPVFPTLPTNYVLLAAVYLQAAITQIYTADIVDKRLFVARALVTDSLVTGPITSTSIANSGQITSATATIGATTTAVNKLDVIGTIGKVTQYKADGTYSGTINPGSSFLSTPLYVSQTATVLLDITDNWADVYVSNTITKSSTATLGSAYCLYFASSLATSATGAMTLYKGIALVPQLTGSAGVTTAYGIDVGPTLNTAITTFYGLRIDPTLSQAPTTAWGLAVESGMNNYMAGRLTLGTAAGVPTWNMHVQGGNAATTAVGFDLTTTEPTNPGSSASIAMCYYSGSGGTNKYLLFKVNDAGTTRYFYMNVHGTSAAWTEATTIPT